MDRMIAMLALASLALGAQAGEAVEISAKSRSQAVESAAATRLAEAPFREARDPFAALFKRDETTPGTRASACERAAALCYDLDERRLVYRGAREYMPRIQGLTAESVSLRRDRLVLKYSFR